MVSRKATNLPRKSVREERLEEAVDVRGDQLFQRRRDVGQAFHRRRATGGLFPVRVGIGGRNHGLSDDNKERI